tara:strand:+ start:118 stop:360 length:243 start_codon:yes stop_codon:yes gene_type:complete
MEAQTTENAATETLSREKALLMYKMSLDIQLTTMEELLTAQLKAQRATSKEEQEVHVATMQAIKQKTNEHFYEETGIKDE